MAKYLKQRFQIHTINLEPKAIINNRIVQTKGHIANVYMSSYKAIYIYSQKCLDKTIGINELKERIRKLENVGKFIAVKNDRLKRHNKKWYIQTYHTSESS